MQNWYSRRAFLAAAIAFGSILHLAGFARAANYSINYRGKTSFSASATTLDQNGVVFAVNEMSGITYRGGNNFTAVSDENGKLIDLNVTFNSDGSIASKSITG